MPFLVMIMSHCIYKGSADAHRSSGVATRTKCSPMHKETGNDGSISKPAHRYVSKYKSHVLEEYTTKSLSLFQLLLDHNWEKSYTSRVRLCK